MSRRTRILALGASTVALAALGVGIAQAVSGSEEPVTGPAAAKAAAAARAAAGGGTVLEVERQDGDGRGVYEVEVRRTDGSQVEIHLDGEYRVVDEVADDDASGQEDDRGSDD
ncbi:MAG TPA: PepSY domain-containing protein [Gaiellaceae bacterium]|nr:PepSY domain-containing protein [Gaiellaceae bacterium]